MENELSEYSGEPSPYRFGAFYDKTTGELLEYFTIDEYGNIYDETGRKIGEMKHIIKPAM